jgi:hypothetical protein
LIRPWSRIVQKTPNVFAAIAMAMAAAVICSGCPALMVPGLAYSGYQYVHKKDQPEASASSTSTHSAKPETAQSKRSTTHSTRSATAQKKSKTAQTAKLTTAPPQKIPDNEIE